MKNILIIVGSVVGGVILCAAAVYVVWYIVHIPVADCPTARRNVDAAEACMESERCYMNAEAMRDYQAMREIVAACRRDPYSEHEHRN